MGFFQGAREEGVQVLVGGDRMGTKGAFVQPTVFLNPDLKSKVYTDEIFGPVITVRTFKDEAEETKLANDTTYGLGCKSSAVFEVEMRLNHSVATVYTSDIARALRVADQIEAGTVGINSAFNSSPQTPFGGFKQSGLGKESGYAGLHAYLQAKTIHINMKTPARAKL